MTPYAVCVVTPERSVIITPVKNVEGHFELQVADSRDGRENRITIPAALLPKLRKLLDDCELASRLEGT